MSKTRQHLISCPFCGREQDVELWDVLDIDTEPELRDALLGNRINRVECAGCAKGFRIDKPLIYRHYAEGILVHCEPLTGGRSLADIEAAFLQARSRLDDLLPEDVDPPEIHLVVDWAEFIERVFLLEEGLDARLVEHVKYILYRQNPGVLSAERKNLLFNAQDSTDEQLCFIVQDRQSRKLESILHFARAHYEALLNIYDAGDQQQLLMEQYPGPYLNGRLQFLKDQDET